METLIHIFYTHRHVWSLLEKIIINYAYLIYKLLTWCSQHPMKEWQPKINDLLYGLLHFDLLEDVKNIYIKFLKVINKSN